MVVKMGADMFLKSTYIKGRLLQQRSSYAMDVSVVIETMHHSNESLKGTQLMTITPPFSALPLIYAPIEWYVYVLEKY